MKKMLLLTLATLLFISCSDTSNKGDGGPESAPGTDKMIAFQEGVGPGDVDGCYNLNRIETEGNCPLPTRLAVRTCLAQSGNTLSMTVCDMNSNPLTIPASLANKSLMKASAGENGFGEVGGNTFRFAENYNYSLDGCSIVQEATTTGSVDNGVRIAITTTAHLVYSGACPDTGEMDCNMFVKYNGVMTTAKCTAAVPSAGRAATGDTGDVDYTFLPEGSSIDTAAPLGTESSPSRSTPAAKLWILAD